MKGTMLMIRSMDMEYFNGAVGMFIRENIKMMRGMGMGR
jgi:hypothetical protein